MKSLFISMILLVVFSANAQLNEMDGYIITSTNIEEVRSNLANQSRGTEDFIKSIFPDANIYKVQIGESQEQLLTALQARGIIESFTPNVRVSYRNTPNDSQYNNQGNMQVIGAEEAWNNTTGGTTIDGKQIVVAILDDGFDIEHPDLINNTWTNIGEIPNDGIDNDNNSYIDDYYGLNVDTGQDDHPIFTHGTAVAGIIGAEGNNSQGVAGVNWNIKMLYISQPDFVDEIIEGYNYVYELRKLYNETQGAQGSFIVSTNFSAGIDGGQAETFPDWCNVFDTLGEVGIISVVATTNRDSDVDDVGDMPSTCPSPFMIAVTNTTQNDFFDNAGRGTTSVDLAAPGTGTLTTDKNSAYDEFGGTSGATPHVAGSIALLYSLDCSTLIDITNDNPKQAAEIIRDAILVGGDDLTELNDITVTGKRLNILGAMKELKSVCGGVNDDALAIVTINGYEMTSGGINLQYTSSTNDVHNIVVVDVLGRIIYSDTFTPPFFGDKTYNISTENMVGGTYFVSLIVNDEKVSKSLSIIR